MYYNEKKRLKIVQVVNIGMDIDEALSDTSENPVQNKVVAEALKNKQDKLTAENAGNGINIDGDKIAIDSETIKKYSMTPSENYIDIKNSIDFTKTGYHTVYEAPANGYVNIYYNGSSSDLWVANRTALYEVVFPNRTNSGVLIPVAKGDKIQFYSTNAGNTTYSFARFIYAKE